MSVLAAHALLGMVGIDTIAMSLIIKVLKKANEI